MAEQRIDIKVSATGAAEAAKVLDSIAKSGAQLGGLTVVGAKRAEDALNSLGGTAKRVFEIFTGVSLSNLFAQGIASVRAFTQETAKLGLEAKVQEDAFARLSASVGVSGDALVAQMNKAAGGILNTSDVMIAAAKALNQSLQPEQIVNLMSIARQQSKLAGLDVAEAFNRITEAIANQQPRALKQLGIVVDMEEAFKKHAATLGVEVSQLTELAKTLAIYNAVAEQTKNSVKALTGEALTQSEHIQKMAGAWKQAKEDIGKIVVDVGFQILTWLQAVRKEIGDITPNLQTLGKVWGDVWANARAVLEPFVTLIGGFKGIFELLTDFAAHMGVTVNAVFASMVGPAVYFGSILKDIANKSLPDIEKAMLASAAAQTEANKRYADSKRELEFLRKGLNDSSISAGEAGVTLAGFAGIADMGRNKLAGLGGQVKALVPDLKALAAEAEKISGGIRGLTDKLAVESLLPQEAEIAALLNPFTEKLANLDNLLAADRQRLIEWAQGMATAIVGLKAMKVAVEEAMVVLRENEETPSRGLLDAAKAWSDLGVKLHEIQSAFALTGDEEKRLQDAILATTASLIFFNETLGDSTDDAETMRQRLSALIDEMRRLTTFRATAEDVGEAWKFVGDASTQAAIALGDYATSMGQAEQEAALLGKGLGTELAQKISLTEQAILKAAAAFGTESEAVRILQERLAGLKTQELSAALAAINTEAALFGDRFDKVGATVSAMESRLRDLARTSDGIVTPAMRELADQLEELRQFQDLRDMFQDIFSSVGGAFNTLVQGVILGTQTMSEAFKKLGQSVVIEFINRIIQQGLNPLAKAAASVVAGLFAPTSKAAASALSSGGAGGGDGAAVSDAGGGFGIPSIPTGLADVGTLSNLWSGATNAWGAFNASLEAGEGVIHSFSGALDSFMVPLSGAATGLTTALAGAGAAIAVFSTIMDFVNGKTEAAIGGVVGGTAGAVAGGLVGTYLLPGVGTVLGALVGGALGDLLGSFLGGLFGGGPSNYELKRSMAAADANAQVGGITTGFAGAARTGTSAATLAALQSGQAPWGSTPNPLRTDLALPPALAEQLGLAAKAEIENGRAIVHWADVTQEQFDKLIKLFESDPSMIAGSVRGKGDVSYLGQSDTHALGDQLEQGAVALLTAFTAFESVRDKINGLASDIVAAAGEVMPPNMAEQLAAHIVNPIRDAMLAVLQDPDLSVEDMQAELDKMGATLESKVQSWEQFAQAMQAAQIIAPSLPDDLPDRMTAALAPVYDAVVSTMRNGTAKQAQAAADNYAKQVALWAAFGEAATHAIDLEAILPEDLGDRFAARMQPQYDKILSTLESGNVNLATAQVAAYTKQMAAWASIGQTVSKITSELAANSGDTSSAVETWQAVQGEMDRTVARAKVAFDAAVNSGDIERVAKTAATYHDATMARLQAERAAVQQIEAAFDTLLKSAAAVQDTLAGLAAADIGSGDATAFTEILHSLADIAMVAPTVNQRIAAIGSGFSAIVTALGNADVDKILNPLTLIAQTSSAAAPFFGALSDMIETATKAGDLKGALGFLQQQAEAIKQIGAAAVQAVREWASAAIAAVEKEAAAKIKAINEQADREIKLREAAIKNWQAQLAIAQTIEGLYTGPNSPLSLTQQVAAAAHAGQVALSRFQAAPSVAGLATVQSAATRYLTIFTSLINEQIALLQKWQAAVDSTTGFIESLYTGPNSPLSLKEQRGLAAGVGQAALSAYTANPTPEGLTALQAAASRYLTISLAAIREKADAEIEAVNAARDARVSALNAEIQSVQDAAAAEQQLIADRIDALQEQIAVTREWEGVVKSVGDLIKSMVTGPLAAGNPMDRLTAAKDAFAQAQKAFAANPTAGNAADVQSAAQALLPLAESLLSKPSPAYQALFASVIKVLEGVKGVAGSKAGPVSSADLEAQIKPLQEESKRIGEYAKQTVAGIQMQIEAVNKSAADTIKAINEAATQEAKDITKGVIDALTAATALAPQDIPGQIAAKQKELKDTVAAVITILADAGQLNGMSSDDLTTLVAGAQAQIDWWTHWRETETALAEKLKQAQIDAITATATTTFKNIQEGVAAALRENASAQKTITDKLVADTAGVLAAVTRGPGSGLIDGVAFLAGEAITTNETLKAIQRAIEGVTKGATGIERVEPGLYELHKNEAVLTESQANKLRAMGGPRALDRIRSAADGAGLPDPADDDARRRAGLNPRAGDDPRLNDWNWIYNQPRDLSKEGQAWAGPKAAELNALELRMRQLTADYENTVQHNTYKKGGKIYKARSDEELAMMRTALDAEIDAIKAQQRAIIATVPKTQVPPPGTPPPGTPPTVPPKVPPYTPPGPGWLNRGGGLDTNRGGGGLDAQMQGVPAGTGPITVVLQVDGKTIGQIVLPAIQDDLKNGKSGLLVDARVKSVRK